MYRVSPATILDRRCDPPGELILTFVKGCGGDWEHARRRLSAAHGDIARAIVALKRTPQRAQVGQPASPNDPRGRQGLPREAARRMKVLAFWPRRPSRAEILRLVRDARCGPALAGMTRRASPAGSRAKVGAAAEAFPATPGNAGPIGRPAVNRTAHYWTHPSATGPFLEQIDTFRLC